MEVHHHSHTSRKKWTHYFWEFLMLFLAVFCGFLAEYQLEHKIEKERGKQYVYSFYRDLITDTSTFSNLIAAYEIKVTAMDSREACYDSLDKSLGENCIWNLVSNSIFFPDLIYTDRTLQQLKNAGGLRLLKNADADSILLYDNMLKAYKTREITAVQESQSGIRNTLFSLINHKSFNSAGSVSFMYGNNNKEALNRYFNELMGYAAVTQECLSALRIIKKKAVDLIGYFKTRYKFK